MAKEKSPAFMLFHAWVQCRVPEYATLSKYSVEEQGLFLPEDKKKANAILLEKIPVYMRPYEMAEYLDTGMAMDINDPNDAIRVYEWIMHHLTDWLNFMESPTIISKPIPMVGLRQFNNLAKKLFPVANRYGYFKKPSPTVENSIAKLLGCTTSETAVHRFNDTIMRRIEGLWRTKYGGR